MGQLEQRSKDLAAGQKRNGTVMFSDVAGFTRLAERLGEEAAFEVIQTISALMHEVIHDEGGTVGEFRGDGVMALFGVAAGLEDGPLRACRAALRIQSAVAEAGDVLVKRHGEMPRVRIGLHCGALVVGDVGNKDHEHITIIGDAANTAARLEQAAEPAQILISGELLELVEGQVEARDLGTLALKGKSREQRVHVLEGIREDVTRFEASRSRGLSTLRDREEELTTLNKAHAQAQRGEIVTAGIVGEPGIGKSRLVHEFQNLLDHDKVNVFKGDCRVGGAALPFLPFAVILRGVLDLDTDATAAQAGRRIDRMLNEMDIEPDSLRPYLLALLGKSGEVVPGESADTIGARMRQTIIELLLRSAATKPVVLVMEDLHWADSNTVDVINQLMRANDAVSLTIICTYRPDFIAPWQSYSEYVSIEPRQISDASARALIDEVMAGVNRGSELAALAVEKAEGNPLFAEEVAKFLMQSQGETQVSGDTLVLPANVQNIIMERFDRLDPGTRNILQAASAIGRRFDGRVAFEVAGTEGDYDTENLNVAIDAEMILVEQGETNSYYFKHALVQDAIYDTLLTGQRRNLHARIANALVTQYGDRTEEAAETLAYHYDQAQMPREAAPYYVLAATRNLSLFSLDAAERSFARAYELIEADDLELSPDLTAMLFAGWFEVQQWRAEFGRILRIFEAQSARLASAVNDPRYPRVLALVGQAYNQNMEFDRAREQLDEAIAIGERIDDRDAIIHGCLGLLAVECTQPQPGYWARNRETIARVHDLLGDDPHPYYRTYCTFYECWSHSIRGDFGFPIDEGHKLFEMGRRTNFSGAVGWGSICVSYNEAQLENFDIAIKFASVGAEEAGGMVDRMVCLAVKGYSLLMSPHVEGSIAEGTRILQDVSDTGTRLEYRGVENLTEGPLGLARVLAGDFGGGVQQIRQAIDNAVHIGNLHGAALSQIALGMIYLQLISGSEKPSLKLLARNAIFLIKETPFAKARAIEAFDAAAVLGRDVEMHGVTAQALFGKAKVLKIMRRTEPAREALQEAQEVLKLIRSSTLQNQVDTALAELG